MVVPWQERTATACSGSALSAYSSFSKRATAVEQEAWAWVQVRSAGRTQVQNLWDTYPNPIDQQSVPPGSFLGG
jgi:hypothetical protein